MNSTDTRVIYLVISQEEIRLQVVIVMCEILGLTSEPAYENVSRRWRWKAVRSTLA